MKKIIAILSILALTSCGGGTSEESVEQPVVADSVEVSSDTLTTVDSVELNGTETSTDVVK